MPITMEELKALQLAAWPTNTQPDILAQIHSSLSAPEAIDGLPDDLESYDGPDAHALGLRLKELRRQERAIP